MRRIRLSFVWLGAIVFLASCAPTITVVNNTTFPVRVVVVAGGTRQVLSPSPNGESSSAEVTEGRYVVTAIPDAEWIEYAKLTRKVLNEELANADNLSGPRLLEVIRRLKDIAARMQQFEQAAGTNASCAGNLAEGSSSVLAQVNVGANGRLVIACR